MPLNRSRMDPTYIARLSSSLGKKTHWQDILENRCVVVLGEAGTGKTAEFQLQVEKLKGQNASAFFISIEDLAQTGVKESLSLEDRRIFDIWKDNSTIAYFFLDSLDEARLRGHRFVKALRNIESELGPDFVRTRLIISSRVSDWRAESDREALESIIPNNNNHSAVNVVSLAPLDESQVKSLSTCYGVDNTDEFLNAIARASAQIFVERPRDVEWLASYWREHGRLGCLVELVEHNINQKLLERNPDHRTLITPNKARQGAEALAGIASLNQKASFLLPGDVERSSESIDPQEILFDWKNEEISDLLTRSLFDESTYGRVRIHHRSVQEFLTANWLEDLAQNGLSSEQIDQLLFCEGSGGTVVVKEFRGAAAWFALRNDHVRDKLVRVAPEILIDEGDPSKLPVEVRCELLRSYASKYKDRSRLFFSFDHVGLGRFADNELAETINELLKSAGDSEELRETLLNIVAEGAISRCSDSVFQIATNPTASVNEKVAAVRAAGIVGSSIQRKEILKTHEKRTQTEIQIAKAIVTAFYPDVIGANDVIKILRKVEPQDKKSMSSRSYFLSHHLESKSDDESRLELIGGLVSILRSNTNEKGQPTHVFSWLLDPLSKLVSAFVNNANDENNIPSEVEDAIDLFERCVRGDFHIYYGVEDIRKVIEQKPQLRRHFYWKRVSELTHEVGRSINQFKIQDGYRIWSLSAEDESWLAADIKTKPDFFDRRIALDTLIHLPCAEVQRAKRNDLLRKSVIDDPALQRRLHRWERRWYEPYPQKAYYDRLDKARALRQERQIAKDREWLNNNIVGIRSGSNLRVLLKLCRELKDPFSRTIQSVEPLVEKYGEDVALAARDGWKCFWKKNKPPLAHEEASRNSVSNIVIVGLSGIYADLEDGLDITTLSSVEAEYAVRYALREINDSPEWLNVIAEHHPEAVKKVFLDVLTADYRIPADHDFVHDGLSKLRRFGPVVKNICAPILMDLLKNGEPENFDALVRTLESLLFTSDIDLSNFFQTVPARCRAAQKKLNHFALWWTIWFHNSPDKAVDELEKRLRTRPTSGDDLLLAICDRLFKWSESHAPFKVAPTTDLDIVQRLVRLIFLHIRPDDDITHNGVYSPGPRDHSESIRRHLFDHMSSLEGSGQALRTLASEPAFKGMRDWFLHLADQRDGNLNIQDTDLAERIVALYKNNGLSAIKKIGITSDSQMTIEEKILSHTDNANKSSHSSPKAAVATNESAGFLLVSSDNDLEKYRANKISVDHYIDATAPNRPAEKTDDKKRKTSRLTPAEMSILIAYLIRAQRNEEPVEP